MLVAATLASVLLFRLLFLGALASIVACSTPPSAAHPSPDSSISSRPATPIPIAAPTPAWAQVLEDIPHGYSLRYPDGWVELHEFEYTGSHFLASRAGIKSAKDLIGRDFFFFADAYRPDPTRGCGPPVNPITKVALTLEGAKGVLYTGRGVQADNLPVADIQAERSGNCYWLQLTGGPEVATSDSGLMLTTIASTFRFTH